MKLSDELLKKINAIHEPSSTLTVRFGRNDIVIRTDQQGNAFQMFIGKKNDSGKIRGERYTRTMVRDRSGNIIKDFWECKGRAT